MMLLLRISAARTSQLFAKPRTPIQWSCIALKDQRPEQFEARRLLRIKAGSSIPYWRDITRHDAIVRRYRDWTFSGPVFWLISFYFSAMVVLVVYMWRPFMSKSEPRAIESTQAEPPAITEQIIRKESWSGRISRRLLGFTNDSEKKIEKPFTIKKQFEIKLPHIWRDPEVLEEVCEDLISAGITVQRASIFNWGLIYFSYTVERPTIEEALEADKELGRKVIRKMWELKMIEMAEDIFRYGKTFYKRYIE